MRAGQASARVRKSSNPPILANQPAGEVPLVQEGHDFTPLVVFEFGLCRVVVADRVDQQGCFVENANLNWPRCGFGGLVMVSEHLADGVVGGAAYDKLQVGAPEKTALDDLHGETDAADCWCAGQFTGFDLPADLVLKSSGIELMQLVHTKTETGRHDGHNGPICFVTGNAPTRIGHEFHTGP